MIDRIRGRLLEAYDEHAFLDVGAFVLELHTAAVDTEDLVEAVGLPVTLYAVDMLQSSGGSTSFVPTLFGFVSGDERDFFLRLVGGGLGPRGAQRALALPFPEIARAIEAEDVTQLTRLPGIGRQRAGELVAKLKGKVTRFALAQRDGLQVAATVATQDVISGALSGEGEGEGEGRDAANAQMEAASSVAGTGLSAAGAAAGRAAAATAAGRAAAATAAGRAAAATAAGRAAAGTATAGAQQERGQMLREGYKVLEQLGYSPAEAAEMVSRALVLQPDLASVEGLIQAIYAARA